MISKPLKIFFDTNIFVATFDTADSTHTKVVNLNEKIPPDAHLYTSSEVVSETLTVLSQKLGKAVAKKFLDFLNEQSVSIIVLDEEIFHQTIDVFVNIRSKNVSFVDCTSFVIFETYKLDAVFTFDTHFRQQKIPLLEDVV